MLSSLVERKMRPQLYLSDRLATATNSLKRLKVGWHYDVLFIGIVLDFNLSEEL
ncbi:hypothetical protein [Chamaesiphon polymorphus]|uniref:hypothetical protein n=1 Tax=Chamaesiphon polymorphus TaxID=2107691 RepID=UPI001C62D7C9|nr:hypothetical protein [Chamaesiphon polymorphus]